MEDEHGSLFKAVKAKMKNSPKKKQGKLSSFTGGMEDLINALRENLTDKITIISGAPVTKITLTGDKTKVLIGNEEKVFDITVTACPAEPTANMLQDELGDLYEKVRDIPYSSINVVPQAFKSPKPENINAFGYLIPSSEPTKTLGVLFDSCVFPGRAPENTYSLRAMVGGGKDPDITKKSDEEILRLILKENQQTLGIDKQADFHKIIRWQKAIPRYELGHWKIIQDLEAKTEKKALFVTGNAFYGISMNDCVTASANTAEKVKDFLENK